MEELKSKPKIEWLKIIILVSSIIIGIIVLVLAGFFAFKILKKPSKNEETTQTSPVTTATQEDFIYERKYQPIIKGVLDPGANDVKEQVTTELENIKSLGANTLYIYVDYSYKDNKLIYTDDLRMKEGWSENNYKWQIENIKKKGFAVHLALTFGGGGNSKFNVTKEKLLKDIKTESLKWAKTSEDYKVETFAPASELDWQIFREYCKEDWEDKECFKQASVDSNKFHKEMLPEVKNVFKGKTVYQSGLHTPNTDATGYDIFGQGLNQIGSETTDFEKRTKEVLGYATQIAKKSNTNWMITEFWIPIYEMGEPNKYDKEWKSPSGISYKTTQDQFYKIAIDHFKTITDPKPIGFTFTSYVNPYSSVKGTKAEEIVKEFYKTYN